jgi:LDH2 family malate/lactate/ureidoglycolate dehydrogenase
VIIDAATLRAFTEELLVAAGTDSEIAAEVAAHLIGSNLAGHDSHGVIRVPQYVARIQSGELDPKARPVMLREGDVTALIDARRGFGHFATGFAFDWAIARARERGLAAAAVQHCTHMGRLGEFTERAADARMLAILTVGAAGPGVGGMVPFGGSERFLGANPWSFSIPAAAEHNVVVDASSSMVAEGKVKVALAADSMLPPGVITGANGRPTSDPREFAAGGLVPLGGEVAGHKGTGFALASALFGALAMIGDGQPTTIGASVQTGFEGRAGQSAGVFLLVIDPARFGDADQYRHLVDSTVSAMHEVVPAPGFARVLVPGDPEANARAKRLRDGIELPEATWTDLVRVATQYGVPAPGA